LVVMDCVGSGVGGGGGRGGVNTALSRGLDPGVIVPCIDDAAGAEAFVAACLYPPWGKRSWAPLRANLLTQQGGARGDGYHGQACLSPIAAAAMLPPSTSPTTTATTVDESAAEVAAWTAYLNEGRPPPQPSKPEAANREVITLAMVR